MKVAVKSPRVTGDCNVDIQQEFGWRRYDGKGLVVWAKGYGKAVDGSFIADEAVQWRGPPTVEQAGQFLNKLDGHFAIAVCGPGWTFAAVDPVRSIPVAFAEGPEGWVVDDQAERLRTRLGLENVNADAAPALAMAGYTIDTSTLFEGIEQLGPGEFVFFRHGEAPTRHRYYCYCPWCTDKPAYNANVASKALAETTLEIIDDMMKGIGDRILTVPLSAGRDSRLIVSAARYLGYRNVRTFAYGRVGNHEAEASRAIAERLGYEWQFVPTDTGFMRGHYASEDWSAYLRFADSLQSVPFVQDLPQIQSLKNSGYIPDNAVIANGNSGDFISGNHIPPPMDTVALGLSAGQRRKRITQTLYNKHFALWTGLQSDANEHHLRNALWNSIELAGGALGDSADDYGLFEYAEFQDRQCKFVITGQRIYEFLGHEWRMPLWDKAYLDFFEKIPLEGKVGQRLYADMLEAENWGGVWQNIPVNRKTVKPDWIRPLRWAAKVAHIPLGRDKWHQFERQYFQYWMTGGAQSALRSYRHVALDRRGARNAIAWLTEAYLNSHGLNHGGHPLHGGTVLRRGSQR